jgi:hypothetical protein
MSTAKTLLFSFLGVVFWFIAAMIIHYAGARAFSAGNPILPLVFALAVPLTLLSMYLTTLVGNVHFRQLLEPVVIMTFTAAMLDGVALAWFRPLYSPSFDVALHGASWILWGAGLGLLFAHILHRTQKPVMPTKSAVLEKH